MDSNKILHFKEKNISFNALALSRNGKYMLVNESNSLPGGVKNTISVYNLDKDGIEKPSFLTKTEIITNWEGGKIFIITFY